jgi:hypothetical protein
MVRITSIEQAIALRGTIPEIAVIRSQQFMGDGYQEDIHGFIVVLQNEPNLSVIHEIGAEGLNDSDGLPAYEYIEVFVEGEELIYEIVYQVDADKTVAVIVVDGPWLDIDFRMQLSQASEGCTPIAL